MKASSRCDCDIFGRPGVIRTLPWVAARPVASLFIPWRKKKFVIFSLRLLVYFLLPCICFNCFLGSTFLCESRVFNVSCVSRVLLIHAYGCQPHTPFHCMRSETPSCKRKKKVSSHSLSPYCFSSDVRAVVSCELSKALMVIRCLHRREPPGRWKWFSKEPYFIRVICFILCELLRCDDAYTISGLCVRVSFAYHPSFFHQSCVFLEISLWFFFSFFEWFLFAFGDLILVITDAEMTYVNLFYEANECYFFICVWRIEVYASYFSWKKG